MSFRVVLKFVIFHSKFLLVPADFFRANSWAECGNNPAAHGTNVQTLLVMSSWIGIKKPYINGPIVVVSSTRSKPTVPFYSKKYFCKKSFLSREKG